MQNTEMDLYTDYLLSRFGASTVTGLSQMVDGAVSHDQVTWFLFGRDYTSKDFIAALKDNRLVALSLEDWKAKRFVRIDKLEFPERGTVQGWLKGSAQAFHFIRQVFALPLKFLSNVTRSAHHRLAKFKAAPA